MPVNIDIKIEAPMWPSGYR